LHRRPGVASNPAKTWALADAKVKISMVDAAIPPQLLAASFLPLGLAARGPGPPERCEVSTAELWWLWPTLRLRREAL
jgi:hypothetical protein